MIVKMLRDVASVLWVLCVFVFGFTHAFFTLACASDYPEQLPSFASYSRCVTTMLMILFGEFPMDEVSGL
jgi:hypothetical protein